MLDIKFLRENSKVVQKAAKDKGIEIDIDHVLEIDQKHHELQLTVQKLREERNILAKNKDIEKGKALKDKLEKEERALQAVEEELREWLYKVPNIPSDDVPAGRDESENKVIRKSGAAERWHRRL